MSRIPDLAPGPSTLARDQNGVGAGPDETVSVGSTDRTIGDLFETGQNPDLAKYFRSGSGGTQGHSSDRSQTMV